MIELNLMGALTAAGQALVFASLVYFFYLVVRHGEWLRHAGHEGDRRPLRAADAGDRLVMDPTPASGAPETVLEEIAVAAARLARGAR